MIHKNRVLIVAALVSFGCLSGCGAVREAQPKAAKTSMMIKADLARMTTKCDDSLQLCRFSILPDLRESHAGRLSMLGVILSPSKSENSAGLVQSLFGFQIASKKVQYRECEELEIQVDGALLPKKQVKYHQAMGTRKVVEGVTVELSIDELLRISRAGDVRCDLCGNSRKLRGEEKVLLAQLFEMWRGR